MSVGCGNKGLGVAAEVAATDAEIVAAWEAARARRRAELAEFFGAGTLAKPEHIKPYMPAGPLSVAGDYSPQDIANGRN